MYENQFEQISLLGYLFSDNEDFATFMSNDVAKRLFDEEGNNEYESHLRNLVTTQFGSENLESVLNANIPEEREWAIGESIAESWLSEEYGVIWPWNMERDKRVEKASLPGADLVGFLKENNEIYLVLGEVKTSNQNRCPPNVMNGRSGMRHQIDRLATNLGVINKLLKWLYFRCKNTEYETYYNQAAQSFFNSGNKTVCLCGVLIRDTEANELDLIARGEDLKRSINAPTICRLIALYLGCEIAELPERVGRGEAL